MVGEQNEFLLLVLVPHHDPGKEIGAVFLGAESSKADTLIREDISVLGRSSIVNDRILGVFLQLAHKEEAI